MPQNEADLAAHRCVVYGRSDGLVNPWLFAGAQSGDLERRVVPGRMAIGDGESQTIAVSLGHGVAQLPTWLVGQHLAGGTLVEVLPQLATDGLPINLVWQKGRQSLPKVSALLDALGACLTPAGHHAGRPAAIH